MKVMISIPPEGSERNCMTDRVIVLEGHPTLKTWEAYEYSPNHKGEAAAVGIPVNYSLAQLVNDLNNPASEVDLILASNEHKELLRAFFQRV